MGSSFFIYTIVILLIYVIYEVATIGILFRDKSLNNIEKALWIVLFLVVPIISIVLYLLFREYKKKLI